MIDCELTALHLLPHAIILVPLLPQLPGLASCEGNMRVYIEMMVCFVFIFTMFAIY